MYLTGDAGIVGSCCVCCLCTSQWLACAGGGADVQLCKGRYISIWSVVHQRLAAHAFLYVVHQLGPKQVLYPMKDCLGTTVHCMFLDVQVCRLCLKLAIGGLTVLT